MKRFVWWVWCALVAALVVACSGAETTTGQGGAGGETSAGGGGQGGAGGETFPQCTALCEGGGGAGGSGGAGGGPEPTVDPGYPLTATEIAAGLANGDCTAFAPLPTEDGSWARVHLRTPADRYTTMRFAAMRTPSFAAPNPWVVGWAHVSSLLDPNDIDCEYWDEAEALEEVDSTQVMDEDGNLSEVVVFERVTQSAVAAPGDHEVLCIQQIVDADGEGHPTNLIACGEPGSGDASRDFWQDNKAAGGALHAMCEYGPEYCRAWMATVD